jgi:hypothetical protein
MYNNKYITLIYNRYGQLPCSKFFTIDHKISIYSGFLENIDPEIIASTHNLCWTKRSINIRKSRNCSV